MRRSSQPTHDTVNAQTESTVGNTAVRTDVDVKLVGLSGRALFVDPLKDFLLRPRPLATPDDSAVPFGRKQVVAENVLVVLGVNPVVERFGLPKP